MLHHIKNPDIVETIYSGIFRHIQEHSVLVRYAMTYWGTFRHIEPHLGVIEAYGNIIRHIWNSP